MTAPVFSIRVFMTRVKNPHLVSRGQRIRIRLVLVRVIDDEQVGAFPRAGTVAADERIFRPPP